MLTLFLGILNLIFNKNKSRCSKIIFHITSVILYRVWKYILNIVSKNIEVPCNILSLFYITSWHSFFKAVFKSHKCLLFHLLGYWNWSGGENIETGTRDINIYVINEPKRLQTLNIWPFVYILNHRGVRSNQFAQIIGFQDDLAVIFMYKKIAITVVFLW